MEIKVISLGGSLIAKDGVDCDYLKKFRDAVEIYLEEDKKRKIILVCGGGGIAREYQDVYRELSDDPQNDAADWIGIAATRLNAELLRQVFVAHTSLAVVNDPMNVSVFPGRMLIASGWKPGFSTDYDAVILAQRFSCDTVVNFTDIPFVYSANPDTNPLAKPLPSLTWSEYRTLLGGEWTPGRKTPFDPVAAGEAQKSLIRVIVADGRNITNVNAILNDRSFEGTTISPDS